MTANRSRLRVVRPHNASGATASGGDCVFRSAAHIPSFHRSGMECEEHNRTVAAAGIALHISRSFPALSPVNAYWQQSVHALWIVELSQCA
jgi:hypothetical protein